MNQPDCTPMFETKYPGFVSSGANFHELPKTEEDCRLSCLRDPNCLSYQIDSSPEAKFCWKQDASSRNKIYGPSTTIKEYIFVVKCVNNSVEGRPTN